jgi:hypothetical protein
MEPLLIWNIGVKRVFYGGRTGRKMKFNTGDENHELPVKY